MILTKSLRFHMRYQFGYIAAQLVTYSQITTD